MRPLSMPVLSLILLLALPGLALSPSRAHASGVPTLRPVDEELCQLVVLGLLGTGALMGLTYVVYTANHPPAEPASNPPPETRPVRRWRGGSSTTAAMRWGIAPTRGGARAYATLPF